MWMQDCPLCASSKCDGLQAWMRHLTEHHVIPTEWPSERAAKLTGSLAVRPYTTITESKKKRRKDSIPRPLNSFMLFAQHIRRNVLRVFSDASNSVISQQLGDLWRTVPHNFRTQYDDEANRLVKIHQFEFPNYKYQPKKRQPLNSAASAIHSTVAPAGSTGDCAKLANRPAIRLGSLDIRSGTDNSGKQHNGPFAFKPSLSSAHSAPATVDTSTRLCFTKVEDQSSRAYFYPSAKSNDPTSFRLISPAKLSPKTVVTTHITEQPSRMTPSNCTLYSTKQTAHSLSSVLPPLITPSSKSVSSTSIDLYTQTNQYGCCDSAYASGINSSSSSSASSPAVGDILSPTKPISILGSGAKASPVRRKIQFIPIRPQSQQPPQSGSGTQLTRQRFLSANNGLPDQTPSNNYVLSTSHPCVNNTANTTTMYRLESANSNLATLNGGRRVHQLVAPVYVRLDAESSGTNEDVILTLPPGTTIIQTVGDMGNFSAKPSILQAQNGQGMLAHPVGTVTTSTATLLSSTDQSPKANGFIATREPSSTTEDLSPPPYSCSSASPSAWSPLSGDVFLPLHQTQTTTLLDDDLNYTPESSASCSYSLISNTDSGTYLYESEDSIMDGRFDGGCELVNQVKAEPIYKVENDELYFDVCTPSPMVREEVTEYSTPWNSSAVKVELTSCRSNGSLPGTGPSLIPLAVDVVKPDQPADQVMMDTEAPISDFAMTNEDNFDASFDAMMNSFDITAFLPGTFSANEDPIVANEFVEDNSCIGARIKITPGDSFRYEQQSVEPQEVKFSRQTMCMEESPDDILPNSIVDVDDMLTNLDNPRTVIVTTDYCSTVPHLPNRSIGASKETRITSNSNNILSDIQSRYQNQMNSQHSPLSDLDALDKSSLLIVKPDWSLRV